MGRRLGVALAFLWFLLPVGAVDPEAREPDITVPGTVSWISLADDALAIGTRDPGTRFSGGDPAGGFPDADVWHLFDKAGRAELAGRADYVATGEDCEDRLLDDCAGHVVAVDLSADGQTLLVVSQIARSPADAHRGYIQVIDRDMGLVATRYLEPVPTHAALSDNGTRLTIAARTEPLGQPVGTRLLAFDVSAPALASASTQGLAPPPRALPPSDDGRQAIVVADQAHRAFLGNTGSLVHGAATAAAIAPGTGHWAVTGSADGNVRLFRQEQDAAVYTRKPGSAVTAVAITPDGMAFVAGDDQGRLHLFLRNATAGTGSAAQPLGTLDLGEAAVSRIAWSADGLLLAAAAGDTVHLLQRGPGGLGRIWSDAVGAAVSALAVAPGGEQVAAAWGDKVRVYEAALDIESEGDTIALQPHAEGNVTVTYTNTGNRAVQATLAMRVPTGWSATLERDRVDLPVGGSAAVRVHVTGPTDGKPGKAILWVDHTFDGRTAGTPVGVAVLEVRDLQLRPIGAQSAAITAGGGQRFHLIVENGGNVVEEVHLAATATPGWGAVLQATDFSVPPGGDRTLTLDVQAPQDAVEGDQGTVDVGIPDGPAVTFAVAVGARFGVELTAPPQVPFVPGNVTRYKVEVANTGNILDSVRLSMPASLVPPGWTIQLENGLLEMDAVGLAPGDRRLVEVLVQSPRDVPDDGFLTLSMTAASLGDPSRTDDARTMLQVASVDPVDVDGAAWPLGLLALGVLWAARQRRTRPQ